MLDSRTGRVRAELSRSHLDALLVTALPHIRYLTGFTGSNGVCLVRPRSVTLFTDSRYGVQAVRETSAGIVCRIAQNGLMETAGGFLRSLRAGKQVGFEADHISVSQLSALRRAATGVRLRGLRGTMEGIMARKERGEVELIRRAVAISEQVFRSVLDSIRVGVKELDVAAEISYQHRRNGAEKDAFDPIVAAGRRSALPHARATRNVIRKGDLIVLDFGCVVRGYASDVTRTVVVGRPSPRVRSLYSAVKDAAERALEKVRHGVEASIVDGAARNTLRKAGLEQFFVHSLGHGIGLSVHEAPRLAATSRDRLAVGNVVTIEPGIYLPSLGGIRIEDDILVTRNGYEFLGTMKRDLFVL